MESMLVRNDTTKLMKFSNDTEEIVISSTNSADSKALKYVGLDPVIGKRFSLNGVSVLSRWESECLTLMEEALCNGFNFIFCAPPSSGKRIISFILASKRISSVPDRKVLIVRPNFVLIQKDVNYLREVMQDTNIRVGCFLEKDQYHSEYAAANIIVCNYEIGNFIMASLMEECREEEISTIIVNDLHLVGDRNLGPNLELLLTKINYINKGRMIGVKIEIIGSSSSSMLSDSDTCGLKLWLNAKLYKTEENSVKVNRMLLVENKLVGEDGEVISNLTVPDEISTKIMSESNTTVMLTLQAVSKGETVMVFFKSKHEVIQFGLDLARFPQVSDSSSSFRLKILVEQLEMCSNGNISKDIKTCIANGIGIHHGGVTLACRNLIEAAYRDEHLKILLTTSTLLSAVDLKANLIIITSPMTFDGMKFIALPKRTFMEMSNLAGYWRGENEANCIITGLPHEMQQAKHLFADIIDPIHSSLMTINNDDEKRFFPDPLKSAILEAISFEFVKNEKELFPYLQQTYIYKSKCHNNPCWKQEFHNKILADLDHLVDSEMLYEKQDKSLNATKFGKVCSTIRLAPEEGTILYLELNRTISELCLTSPLHILVRMIPNSIANMPKIKWRDYVLMLRDLNNMTKSIADRVDAGEKVALPKYQQDKNGYIPTFCCSVKKMDLIALTCRKFYIALSMLDIMNEKDIFDVAKNLDAEVETVRFWQGQIIKFAKNVEMFCADVGLGYLGGAIKVFEISERLKYGVKHDILQIRKVSSLETKDLRYLVTIGFIDAEQLMKEEKLENVDSFIKEKLRRNASVAVDERVSAIAAKYGLYSSIVTD